MNPVSSSSALLDDHRARAVAEEDAGSSIGVIDNARHRIGADDQNLLWDPVRDIVRRHRQAINEAGACSADIVSPRFRGAERMLNHAGRRRKHVVRRDGANQNASSSSG